MSIRGFSFLKMKKHIKKNIFCFYFPKIWIILSSLKKGQANIIIKKLNQICKIIEILPIFNISPIPIEIKPIPI